MYNMGMSREEIGKIIKSYREKEKMSQTVLGAKLGRSHVAVSNLEKGKTSISFEDICALGDVFGDSFLSDLGLYVSKDNTSRKQKLELGLSILIVLALGLSCVLLYNLL